MRQMLAGDTYSPEQDRESVGGDGVCHTSRGCYISPSRTPDEAVSIKMSLPQGWNSNSSIWEISVMFWGLGSPALLLMPFLRILNAKHSLLKNQYVVVSWKNELLI